MDHAEDNYHYQSLASEAPFAEQEHQQQQQQRVIGRFSYSPTFGASLVTLRFEMGSVRL